MRRSRKRQFLAGRNETARSIPEDLLASDLAAALGEAEIPTVQEDARSGSPNGAHEGLASHSANCNSARDKLPLMSHERSQRWGPDLRKRLKKEPYNFAASNRPVTDVKIWQTTVFCTSAAGSIKAFDALSRQQVRPSLAQNSLGKG